MVMKRPFRLKKHTLVNWTTEQDIYLIEQQHLPLQDLMKVLPYSEDEIVERKHLLGLTRRERQMQRLLF